ncbi:MAG: hypothetical protein WBX25_10070 [Rhodomicrobium sp.]
MSDQRKAGNTAGTPWPFVSGDVASTMQVQMQALLAEQAQFLDETQKIMAAWTKRRQEAMDANFRTFKAMGCCTDPAAMSAAYGDWLANSMNRIFADMDEARQEALKLAEMGQKSMTALLAQSGKRPSDKDRATVKGKDTRQKSRDASPSAGDVAAASKAAE